MAKIQTPSFIKDTFKKIRKDFGIEAYVSKKRDLGKENVIYVISWILFIGSLLFMVYACKQPNGLAITSINDFYRLVVPMATMFFSFNIINK